MDGSSTRRGVPCWYRRPDVGLGAINDSIFIQSSLYQLLKSYFTGKPYYTDVMNLFNEVSDYKMYVLIMDTILVSYNFDVYVLICVCVKAPLLGF